MSECKISLRYCKRTDISLMFGFIRFLKNNKFVFWFKARVLQKWLQIQSLTDSPTNEAAYIHQPNYQNRNKNGLTAFRKANDVSIPSKNKSDSAIIHSQIIWIWWKLILNQFICTTKVTFYFTVLEARFSATWIILNSII